MPTRTVEEAELSDIAPAPIQPKTNDPTTTIEPPAPQNMDIDIALDALNYIHPQERDPLEVHGWDTTNNLELINPIQRSMWTMVETAKVLAYWAYGGKISDPKDIVQLRDSITLALRPGEPPLVSPPTPADFIPRREPNPLCMLISDLPPNKAKELVDRVSPNYTIDQKSH